MSEQLLLNLPRYETQAVEQGDINHAFVGDCTPMGQSDDAKKKLWLWSLKAGGRGVWFKRPLEVLAFHLLSSDRNCKEIEERPFSEGFPYEDIAWYRFVVGTRSFDGKECLWGVEITSDLRPDGEGGLRPRNWHLVQEWSRLTGHLCAYVRESDIFAHRVLIENWRKVMAGVKQAHDDPDDSLRNEICALAEHPEGVSIEQLEWLIDADPNDTYNQICWLIHENRLLTDLSMKPLNDQYIVHSTRVH